MINYGHTNICISAAVNFEHKQRAITLSRTPDIQQNSQYTDISRSAILVVSSGLTGGVPSPWHIDMFTITLVLSRLAGRGYRRFGVGVVVCCCCGSGSTKESSLTATLPHRATLQTFPDMCRNSLSGRAIYTHLLYTGSTM